MKYDLVLKRNWVQMEEFRNYFGYSQIAPGPLAFQVALYCGYFKKGFLGALLSGFALVMPSYIFVLGISIFYKNFYDLTYLHYALYGISPVIVAIIAKSGFNLSKTIFQKDIFLYLLFFASIVLMIMYKAPIIFLVIAGAVTAMLYYILKDKLIFRNRMNGFAIIPIIAGILLFLKFRIIEVAGSILWQMTLLFLKVGSLTYGSGFVIVGVLRQEVVDNLKWLSSKEFLDGIAIGQITPGPVVITSTFIGYMTSGFIGSVVATVCIFLPTFIFVMLLAQKIEKFKDNFYLKALIKGANATALGAIISTAFILSKDAIIDVNSFVLFITAIVILFFTKFRDIYLIIIAAIVGISLKLFI